MTTETLERDLAVYLENTGYRVSFSHAQTYDWFYTSVWYESQLIARKACCKSYPRAARWAKRRIRRHREALRILGGLV